MKLWGVLIDTALGEFLDKPVQLSIVSICGFCIHGFNQLWLNESWPTTWMWSLWILKCHCTMPLHMKDLIIHRWFWCVWESWNQFTPLPQTEGPPCYSFQGTDIFLVWTYCNTLIWSKFCNDYRGHGWMRTTQLYGNNTPQFVEQILECWWWKWQ